MAGQLPAYLQNETQEKENDYVKRKADNFENSSVAWETKC